MEKERADVLFGKLAEYQNGLVGDNATINSRITWRNHSAENIYTVIEGRDPELKDELIIIEAFYDSTRYVAGRSPGADEALSVANLLQLADHFTYNPPGRSIMLVATAGHAQSLHGMRDLIWSLQERSKLLRDQERELEKKPYRQSKSGIALLDELSFPLQADMERDRQLATVIGNDLKFTIDQISRRLMNLRLQQSESADQNLIDTLAKRRLPAPLAAIHFHDLDNSTNNCSWICCRPFAAPWSPASPTVPNDWQRWNRPGIFAPSPVNSMKSRPLFPCISPATATASAVLTAAGSISSGRASTVPPSSAPWQRCYKRPQRRR